MRTSCRHTIIYKSTSIGFCVVTIPRHQRCDHIIVFVQADKWSIPPRNGRRARSGTRCCHRRGEEAQVGWTDHTWHRHGTDRANAWVAEQLQRKFMYSVTSQWVAKYESETTHKILSSKQSNTHTLSKISL